MPSMQFHISDILALLKPDMISLPEHPPITSGGTQLPPRNLPMEGVVQLVEFLTGGAIPKQGSKIDGITFANLYPAAQEKLSKEVSFMLPLDEKLLPDFSQCGSKEEKLALMRQALPAIEEKYGAYIDVMGVGLGRSGGGGASTDAYQR